VRSRCALVVGFDRNPTSLAALQVAVDLARRLAADVHVVHAIDLSDYPVDPDAATWDDDAEAAAAGERALAAEALEGFDGTWTYREAHGEAAELLADVADEVDALMVVVGGRREGAGAALSHLVSPSVSKRLLGHAATRPVLVVPRVATLS
jgi:nucleotide-binding universal stress UspA family protein